MKITEKRAHFIYLGYFLGFLASFLRFRTTAVPSKVYMASPAYPRTFHPLNMTGFE